MADIDDVSDALVAAIAQVVYPNGTAEPSVSGLPTAIYAGWPQSSQLDKDLAGFANGKGGRIHVTIFPTGTEKNITPYLRDWVEASFSEPTLTLTAVGNQVTIGGTVATPQNVALIVDGQAYAYALQAGDTLTSIATALAVQVPGASSTGAVITFSPTARITAARAGATGTAIRELRRQHKVLQITVWADTPENRKATAKAIDEAMAAEEWITLGDGSASRLTYQASKQDDATQRAGLYRRDIQYTAEYATTETITTTGVIVIELDLHTGVGGSAVPVSTVTTFV